MIPNANAGTHECATILETVLASTKLANAYLSDQRAVLSTQQLNEGSANTDTLMIVDSKFGCAVTFTFKDSPERYEYLNFILSLICPDHPDRLSPPMKSILGSSILMDRLNISSVKVSILCANKDGGSNGHSLETNIRETRNTGFGLLKDEPETKEGAGR
jgi:hypothetical protein